MPRFRLSRPAAPRGARLLLAACCGLGVSFGCVAANAQSAVSGQSAQGVQGVQGAQAIPSTAAPYTSPFAPDLQTGTKGSTPSWEKFNRPPPGRQQSEDDDGLPQTFKRVQTIKTLQPPPSGVGATGFDATNAPEPRQGSSAGGTSADNTPAYGAAASSAGAYGATANGGNPAASSAYGNAAYGNSDYGNFGGSGTTYGNTAYGAQANTSAAAQNVSRYQQPIPPLSGDQAFAEAPGQPPVPSITPIRKSKKKRRAHPDEPTDPFAPTGVRVGTFDVYPAIELLGGYESNPTATEGGAGAAVYTVAPEVKIELGLVAPFAQGRAARQLHRLFAGQFADAEPPLPQWQSRRPYRCQRDTKINLGGRVLVSTDNPGSPNLRAGLAKLPLFTTFGGSAGVTQSFNRFELKLTGDAQRTAYQDSELTDGTTASNEDRNYNQFGGILRGSYEMTPGIKPFVEIGADIRSHDADRTAPAINAIPPALRASSAPLSN